MNFLQVMRDYRFTASWAVWKQAASPAEAFTKDSNLRLPPDENLYGILHARYVLLGLNLAFAKEKAHAWSNFHTSSWHNDHLIAEAFRATPAWGAYMCDLHEARESDSRKVGAENIVAEIASLATQLNLLGATGRSAPTFVCFGELAYRRLLKHLSVLAEKVAAPDLVSRAHYKVRKVPHYSRSNAGVHKHQPAVYRKLVGSVMGWA